MDIITPFTKSVKVRIKNPNDENDFIEEIVDVPCPDFTEDNTDKSTVWEDDQYFESNDGAEILVSVYNSITGGGVFAMWNGKEAKVEELEDID